jgi:isocitrate dehydrogenase
MYWAQALVEQTDDSELQVHFAPLAKQLAEAEAAIVSELNNAQGQAINIGGYYQPNVELIAQAMRPSLSFNKIIDAL